MHEFRSPSPFPDANAAFLGAFGCDLSEPDKAKGGTPVSCLGCQAARLLSVDVARPTCSLMTSTRSGYGAAAPAAEIYL